jgi:hypothetical protein
MAEPIYVRRRVCDGATAKDGLWLLRPKEWWKEVEL